MPNWEKDNDGKMIEVETADERNARENALKKEILLELAPLAQKLLDNPKDDESRDYIMRQLFIDQNFRLMIDAEFIHTRYGGILNFTFIPNGLVIMSYGCSDKYRVDWFDVLTAEKAREKMDELQCVQTAFVQSKDGNLHCSRCGTIIQPYETCPKCKKSWKFWLEEKLAPIREERKKQIQEKIVAEGDVSQICFDFSEEE